MRALARRREDDFLCMCTQNKYQRLSCLSDIAVYARFKGEPLSCLSKFAYARALAPLPLLPVGQPAQCNPRDFVSPARERCAAALVAALGVRGA